ncbi:hypothetical protein RDI58_022163 [Solanum bulbocastanum]|uniref:Uncharacterized protein n=1 Tax=Solanum bulbocastanum TaxID=147425 RepID=A0AAN8Y5E3_SOLBU
MMILTNGGTRSGRVILFRFKVGYNCKVVLSEWLVKSEVYFTNGKGEQGYLFH